MRRFATLAAAAALLLGGAIVLAAASPSPLPSSSAHATPSAHPSATSRPSATTAPSASPAATLAATPSAAPSAAATPAATQPTFSAQVQPLQISGSASVTPTAGGGGTVTLRVSGLLDAIHWSVDIDGGTIARPDERTEIAWKTGADVSRLTMDTVRVSLTKTEMAAFLKARTSEGVVAVVSDGARSGYAEFSAAG